METMADFYEEDEPVEEIVLRFEQGELVRTMPPLRNLNAGVPLLTQALRRRDTYSPAPRDQALVAANTTF